MSNSSFRRMVFVGLGGSGGKTLRFLKRDLQQWLDDLGWTADIPAGWRFLQIDTPSVQDGVEITRANMLEDSEYLGLVGAQGTFEQIDAAIMSDPEGKLELASWRVNPAALKVDVQTGAGMYRAVGSSIGFGYLGKIREALVDCFDAIEKPGAQADLSDLYRLRFPDSEPSPTTTAPLIVVISSLAGGSGAGLVNHVCDLIREMRPSLGGKSIFGLLYTPEVFESVVDKDGGILPNGLAAISEIMNGYWYHGGAGSGLDQIRPKSSKSMQNARAISPYDFSGPAFPFLIGAHNSSGVAYETDLQLFETVGAALTSWTTDLTVQAQLVSYTNSNWKDRATTGNIKQNVLVNQGDLTKNEVGINPFSALGFARVSVGNRYFGAYSSERLARDSFEFIRDNHVYGTFAKQSRLRQPNITPVELIQEQVKNLLMTFLDNCGFNDRKSEHKKFAESVRLSDSDFTRLFNESKEIGINQMVLEDNNTAEVWLDEIVPSIENAVQHFDSLSEPIIKENIRLWISKTPKFVLQVVSDAVGSYGLPITTELVQELINEIENPSEGLIRLLKLEDANHVLNASKATWRPVALEVFGNSSRKVPRGTVVERALEGALIYALGEHHAKINRMSVELLESFVAGFLRPLHLSLQSATNKAVFDSRKSELWPNWPGPNETGSLSDSCKPPMTEYPVMLPSTFPDLFGELLGRTVGGESIATEGHRIAVRSAVISGDFLDEFKTLDRANDTKIDQLRAIKLLGEWKPLLSYDGVGGNNPIPATIECNFDSLSLLARSKKWLEKPGSEFKLILEADLSSFTSATTAVLQVPGLDQIYSKRRDDFLNALEQALSASKPLIGIDSELMSTLVGPGHPKLNIDFSAIPFGSQHPLRKPVVLRLTDVLKDLPQQKPAETYFNEDSNNNSDKKTSVKHIDIVSSLYGAYPVLVIESLLRPIAEAWTATENDELSASEFWDKRRSRGLGEFIAAPQEHIRCMLRGWFSGVAMGLIGKPNLSIDQFAVASRKADQPLQPQLLPKRKLSGRTDYTSDNIARILESLVLAYVDVCRERNLTPLRGYLNLMDLGRSGDGKSLGLNTYPKAADYLEHWILKGHFSAEVSESQRPLVAVGKSRFEDNPDANTSIGRKNLLIGEFQKLKERHVKEFVDFMTALDQNNGELDGGPLWISMRDLIYSALDQLILALQNVDPDKKSTDGDIY